MLMLKENCFIHDEKNVFIPESSLVKAACADFCYFECKRSFNPIPGIGPRGHLRVTKKVQKASVGFTPDVEAAMEIVL